MQHIYIHMFSNQYFFLKHSIDTDGHIHVRMWTQFYKYMQAIPPSMTIPTYYLYHNRPFVHTHRHLPIPQTTIASWILRITIICQFVFLVRWTKQMGRSQGPVLAGRAAAYGPSPVHTM